MMTRMSYRIVLSISLLLFVSALTSAQSQYSLAACKSSGKTNDMLGLRFKVKIDKQMSVRKGRDVDYSSYAVRFGEKQKRAWMNGIYGPNATSGQVPREWLSGSSEVNQRTWRYADFHGVDAKGKLANGN